MILNNSNWSSFAERVANPAQPEEYSPKAVENLMQRLSPFIVHMRNVRPQFHAINGIQMIDFRDEASAHRYRESFDRFLAAKAKLEEKEHQGMGGMGLQILVQLLKFRQAAEEEKCEDIVDAMYDCVENNKEAAVASFNFKYSIAKCVKLLRDKYGVDRDKISIIWGGGNTTVSKKKQKKLDLKAKIENSAELKALFADIEMDDYDLGIANMEEAKRIDDDASLRLGSQDLKDRQKEIDKFQKGKTLYCFFTLKAGGVGLSLHHSDELTKEKCRRNKDSGWAVVEDIPLIPVRPRRLFAAVTYSAMELVQSLGRCPRLSSLSNTYQTILFYRGTIESRVAAIVSVKLRCLRKVVSQKESWEDVILGGHKDDGANFTGEDTIKQIENGSQGFVEEENLEQLEKENEGENE